MSIVTRRNENHDRWVENERMSTFFVISDIATVHPGNYDITEETMNTDHGLIRYMLLYTISSHPISYCKKKQSDC